MSESGCWTIFRGRCVEELFDEIAAAAYAQLISQHAQRVLGSDKMHARHAGVSFEGAQCLASENRAGGAGDGDCELKTSKLLTPNGLPFYIAIPYPTLKRGANKPCAYGADNRITYPARA